MYKSHPLKAITTLLFSFLLILPYHIANAYSVNPDGSTTAVLSFAGDCTLGSSISHQNYEKGFVAQVQIKGLAHPFSGVREIFAEDDVTIVNLEGTFTHSNEAQDKAFVFRAPPAFAEILPLGSVEVVNIANNHILDYHAEGKADTIAALNQFGVKHFGAGELAVYDVGNIRIGMTGYTYPLRDVLQSLAERDIPALRAMGCDIIILSMHAGTEEQYRANSSQKDIARSAIDLGVDIVFGHHPHVLQEVEVYQGKPIFYSLGNFAFGGNVNPKDWDTMIGQVVIEKDENGARLIQMKLIPCLISGENRTSDFRPVLATGDRAQSILRKVRRYSSAIDPSIFETGTLSLVE